MSYVAIFKRIIPFFLTFAAGLFIASFFIQISAPSFSKGEGRRHKRHGYNRVMAENEDLRRENERLRQQIESLSHNWENPGMAPEAPTALPPAPEHRK